MLSVCKKRVTAVLHVKINSINKMFCYIYCLQFVRVEMEILLLSQEICLQNEFSNITAIFY